MIVKFKNRKFQEECNNHRLLERRYGKAQAKRIRRRLDDLQAATVLEDLRSLPGRCHELKGDRAGQLSLDLVHPDRLIFEPIADFQTDDLTPATSSIDEEPASGETGQSLPQAALAKQSEREDTPVRNTPPFIKPDGGLDWKKVTAVLILGVEDTHE